MRANKLFAYFITTVIYLSLCVFFLAWFSYTGLEFWLWALSIGSPYSWWIRVPIILVSTLIMLAITFIGAIPLFWIDKIKRQKKGWLGKLYLLTDEKK